MPEIARKNLDNAKERLRAALEKLENGVEKHLKEAREKVESVTPSATVKEFTDMREKLSDTSDENTHLREENQKLQSEIGNEHEKNRKLIHAKTQSTERIDGLILELKHILSNNASC